MEFKMIEVPTKNNNKKFIICEKGVNTDEGLIFHGVMSEFDTSFYVADNWDDIVAWCMDNDFDILNEGSVEYDNAEQELTEDTYNEKGQSSINGMYDAGGHIISDRYADFIDHFSDEGKDSDF